MDFNCFVNYAIDSLLRISNHWILDSAHFKWISMFVEYDQCEINHPKGLPFPPFPRSK